MEKVDSLPTLLKRGSLVYPESDDIASIIPIEYLIRWISTRERMVGAINRVLVLKSETASGKSTAFPAEIYKQFIHSCRMQGGIICTQPRVLTAIENVKDISARNSNLLVKGETIGWSTRYSKLGAQKYALLYATIGTLTRQLQLLTDEDIISKYKFIIIDETHERDINTDLTLCLLKSLIARNTQREECPYVILMSATLDEISLLRFFGVPRETNFVHCKGASFDIINHWDYADNHEITDYIVSAVDIVKLICDIGTDDQRDRGDILIFLPGKREITYAARLLKDMNEVFAKTTAEKILCILMLDSDVVNASDDNFKRITRLSLNDFTVDVAGKEYNAIRRVILSTNVAETGVTIKTLKYIIDSGYNRESEFNPVHNVRSLVTRPAQQSRITQRKGRVGRLFTGEFYPLYSRDVYDRLVAQQYPAVLTTDASAILADLIMLQFKAKTIALEKKKIEFRIEDIDLVDVPSPDSLAAAIEKFVLLGFLSPFANEWTPEGMVEVPAEEKRFSLTKIGYYAVHLLNTIPIELVRMIIAGLTWKVSCIDLITIAAYFISGDGQPLYETSMAREQVYMQGLPHISQGLDAVKLRALIADDFIDAIIFYSAFKNRIRDIPLLKIPNELAKWCEEINANFTQIMRFIRLRDELIDAFLHAGFKIYAHESRALDLCDKNTFMDTICALKYCIYDGFKLNMIVHNELRYLTSTGAIVSKPIMFEDRGGNRQEAIHFQRSDAECLLYYKISIKKVHYGEDFAIETNGVSLMDGYVNVDFSFGK